MLDGLLGGNMYLKFFSAFAVVLALIGLTAWLVRRFGSNRLGGNAARGRQPRLAVIDAAPVDGRRRLVLIRRDNVEHLLMIGGPSDVVVEQNIVRAIGAGARESTRIEPAVRAAPATEGNWPLQPVTEPAPIPAPRPYRTATIDEAWPEPAVAQSLRRQSHRIGRRIVGAPQSARSRTAAARARQRDGPPPPPHTSRRHRRRTIKISRKWPSSLKRRFAADRPPIAGRRSPIRWRSIRPAMAASCRRERRRAISSRGPSPNSTPSSTPSSMQSSTASANRGQNQDPTKTRAKERIQIRSQIG